MFSNVYDHSFVYKVSDPDHSQFGQFISHEEVGSMTSNPVSTQFILGYLNTKFGSRAVVTEKTIFGEYIRGTVPFN